MRRMRNRWFLTVAFGIALVASMYTEQRGIQNVHHVVQFNSSGLIHFDEEVSHWKERIVQIGSHAAYIELTTAVSGLSISEQHMTSHTFGEALYETKGLQDLDVCDEKFGQGCMHSFFGLAVANRGFDDVVSRLDTTCSQKTNSPLRKSCEHGIGHGILAFVGYTVPDLERALDECSKNKKRCKYQDGLFWWRVHGIHDSDNGTFRWSWCSIDL